MKHLGKIIVTLLSLLVIGLIWKNPSLAGSPGKVSKYHANIAEKCQSCHSPYKGVPSESCITCHELSKIGSDQVVLPGKSKPFHTELTDKNCMLCHTEHAPGDMVTLAGFSHSLFTTDKQKQCKQCHTAPNDTKHTQYTYECSSCHNTQVWKGAVFNHALLDAAVRENCTSCHTVPKNDLHKGITTGCISCHNTTDWKQANIDHDKYFVLDGNHKASCVTCHNSPGNYKVYTCYGCHEHSPERISRKHLKEGINNFEDCARCHKSGNEHDIRGGEGGEGGEGEGGGEHEGREHDGGEHEGGDDD